MKTSPGGRWVGVDADRWDRLRRMLQDNEVQSDALSPRLTAFHATCGEIATWVLEELEEMEKERRAVLGIDEYGFFTCCHAASSVGHSRLCSGRKPK